MYLLRKSHIKENLSKYWYNNGEAKVTEAISKIEAAGGDATGIKNQLSGLKEQFKAQQGQAQAKKDEAKLGGYTGKTFRVGGGSGYGFREYRQGQILHNSSKKVESGEPGYLYVLSAEKRYVREDGMSFGVGDESGYIYSATTREATAEESAPLRDKERRATEVKEAKARMQEIASDIKKRGEHPEGSNTPEGTEYDLSSQGVRLYGGGEWFVVGEKYIWYVRNNGADGDSWANNNVRTGGAGAIGWRIPYDAKLATEIAEKHGVAHAGLQKSLFTFFRKGAVKKSGEAMCKQIGDSLGVDWSKIDLDEFSNGMFVELEHKDVTGGDPVKTAKIVLAHLAERPDYYTRLEKYVEKALSGVYLLRKSHV